MHDLPPLVFLAYLDPGAGSLFLQILISVVLGGWLCFRQKLARALRVLLRRPAATDTAEPPAGDPGPGEEAEASGTSMPGDDASELRG